jgi:hypothetical protein
MDEAITIEALHNIPMHDTVTFTVVKVDIDDGATPNVILRGGDAKVTFSVEPATFTPTRIHLKIYDGNAEVFKKLNVPVSATDAIWNGKDDRGVFNDYATEDEYQAKIRVFYGSGSSDYCEDTVAIKVAELSPVWLEFTDDQPLKDNDGNDIRHADGAHWKRAFGTATAVANDVKHASYKFAGTCKADVAFSAGIGNATHNLSAATEVEVFADGSAEDFGSTSSAKSAAFQNWPSAKVSFESTTLDDEIHYYEDLSSGWFDDSFSFNWRYRVKDSSGNWSSWITMKNDETLHYMCLQRADIQTFSLYEQVVKWGCDWAEGEENDQEDITEKLFDKSISESGLQYTPEYPSSLGEYLKIGNGMCGMTADYVRYLNLVQGVNSRSVFFGPWGADNWQYIVCPGAGLGGTAGSVLPVDWSYYVHDNINNPEWAFRADTGDIDYDQTTKVWVFGTKNPTPSSDGHVINWFGEQLFDLPFMKRMGMFKYPGDGDQSYTPGDDFRDDYFDDGVKWLLRVNAPCHDAAGPRNENLCLQSSEIPTIRINFKDNSCSFNQ